MTATITYLSFGMINVDSNENYSLNWYLMIYYLIAISTMTGVVGWLSDRGQTVSAILVTILLLAIYTFYALRWFTTPPAPSTPTPPCGSPGSSGSGSGSGSKDWAPPIINMCPDFMVVWTDATGNVYCYDDKNTYNLKQYSGAGLTTGIAINNIAGQSAYLIKSGTSPVASSLSSDTNGTRWPFLYMLQNNISTMTNDKYGQYLRWEGVWDGSSLSVKNAPLP